MTDCPGCCQRNDENQGNPGCKAIGMIVFCRDGRLGGF